MPKFVGENHAGVVARNSVVIDEGATKVRSHAKYRKKLRRNGQCRHRYRFVSQVQICGAARYGCHGAERAVLLVPVEEIHRIYDIAGISALRTRFPNAD